MGAEPTDLMRQDLATQTSPQVCETDVAIVGGGIAGFVLANQLQKYGVSCALLESGSAAEVEGDPLFSDVSFPRRVYGGALEGRSRCIGGTSVKWGGQFVPFREADFAPRHHPAQPSWPIGFSDVEPFIPMAENLFALDHGSYDASVPGLDTESDAFRAREAKCPKFASRNVSFLFRDITDGASHIPVWLNATVRGFDVQNGNLRSVTAFGPQAEQLKVTAKTFVFCAGAIETTRLMLLLDEQTNGRAVDGRAHLGRYFQDHLSLPLARIETRSPEKLNEAFGLRFDGQMIRRVRFEQGVEGATAGYIYIAPRTYGPTGFDGIRDFMRSLQRPKPDFKALGSSLKYSPYLARLVWWRFIKKRLLWPGPAEYDVHFVIEQLPDPTNRIVLGERQDQLGHPVAEIDWDITQDDVAEMEGFRDAFEKYWSGTGLCKYGDLVWTGEPKDLWCEDETEVEAVYHPGGTTRMADSANDGVVDKNLRVFGIKNLHLAATSVFPNGGSSNPTMTLILLALRMAEHLKAQR
ncbi:MAG: GMC oxidoreductase [Pseudomonadota bacterium]